MGNVTGAGLGATIGLLGGPIGVAIGATLGAAVGTGAEIANVVDYPSMTGSGGHHLGRIRKFDNNRIISFELARCNLQMPGVNEAATAARLIFAPGTSMLNSAYLLEHHWIIMQLDNGKYITTWKGPEGICAKVLDSREACFIPENCGAKDKSEEVWNPRTRDCRPRNRRVIDFVYKALSMDSYYKLNEFANNCQGYADAIRYWC